MNWLRQRSSGELPFAIPANVLEKQIAESRVRKSVRGRIGNRRPHLRFVDVIWTGMRNVHHVQRQPGGVRLCLENGSTDAVHRYPIHRLVDGRQQRRNRTRMLPIEQMQRPRAVLPRAPRQEDLHLKASGCRTCASVSAARPMRGPAASR